MIKDKLVIDLRRFNLTDKQRKELHKAIHQAVVKQLKKIKPSKTIKPKVKAAAKKAALKKTLSEVMTANMQVTFMNTNPGLSELTAILNGQRETINQSGNISFNIVESGDIIIIQGKSLGNTTVTIDISADPMQMNFPPGQFNDNFFIN